MKKTSKRKLITLILILVLLLFVGVFIIKARGIGSTSTVSGQLRNINNNTITFNSGLLHDYVHVMLESTDSEQIEDGLEFDIINPNGDKVTSGRLCDGEFFRENYKNISGEWKIVLHFKDDISKSMINVGYATNSKKENTMRVE